MLFPFVVDSTWETMESRHELDTSSDVIEYWSTEESRWILLCVVNHTPHIFDRKDVGISWESAVGKEKKGVNKEIRSNVVSFFLYPDINGHSNRKLKQI